MRIVTECHRGCRRPGPGDAWTAIDGDTYDGAPDARSPTGWGDTEAEAIADLLGQTGEIMETTIRVPCEACGQEGRIYRSRYGGNDPDVWDAGPCPECDGAAYVDVETQPVTLEDLAHDCDR